MVDKRFKFWQRMLTYSNILAVLVGLVTAFNGNSFVLEFHNAHTKQVFFDNSEFPVNILNFKNWLFGIIGGTIVGFHILMIMLSEFAIKNREKWAYHAMWFGLLSWFTIDSAISIYYKALHNLWIINIPALVMISLPLIAMRRYFTNSKMSM